MNRQTYLCLQRVTWWCGMLQEEYRQVVQDLHDQAVRVLQQATAALFDGGDNMSTLLTAQEVNEWGSTLAQIAQCATLRRWSLPTLEGMLHGFALPCV